MNFVLSMNARMGQQPHQSDWYQGQQMIESLMQMLYDDSVKCNIIVTSHIQYIGEDNGPQVGYPSTCGKALSPKIGRYFNTVLQAKTIGQGANAKKVILTNSTGRSYQICASGKDGGCRSGFAGGSLLQRSEFAGNPQILLRGDCEDVS